MLSQSARVQLVRVSPEIMSAYDSKGRPGNDARTALQPLMGRTSGRMTPDAAAALQELNSDVLAAGGDFRVTDCFRDLGEQTAARSKYEAWLAAGSPASFDPKIMKSSYVARPGRSFHNAGRAIDVDIAALHFPSTPLDQQLDKLWSIALPLGWRPAIKAPDERASEAWHFDFMGPEWTPVYARLGYEQTAMCAVLDIGEMTAFPQARERSIQANLHRAGYSVGDVDGLLGHRTMRALSMAGINDQQRAVQFTKALQLPSDASVKLVA